MLIHLIELYRLNFKRWDRGGFAPRFRVRDPSRSHTFLRFAPIFADGGVQRTNASTSPAWGRCGKDSYGADILSQDLSGRPLNLLARYQYVMLEAQYPNQEIGTSMHENQTEMRPFLRIGYQCGDFEVQPKRLNEYINV